MMGKNFIWIIVEPIQGLYNSHFPLMEVGIIELLAIG
ncbi:MAG: hypothetical protein K0R93_1632 [Anaerosolibacter sp.]|jgi:hypothetical protein|nr:hypothetical protein [Anaerosolibacter sp.]